MGKNQSASNLTNIIKQDASGNITFVSGSTTLMSVSSSGAITTTGNVAGTASYASNAELLDGLDSTVFTLTSSFTAQTASFTAFTASQNILNGTYSTTGSNIFRGSQYISSSFAPTNFTDTASLYTDGGLRVTRNAYLSSSLYVNGDLIIFGSQSVNYISSSQLDIADNIITVNTSTPTLRFGGLAVKDSGSLATGLTGSLLWDSQDNQWIYSNPSGSEFDSAVFLVGPRNYGTIGNEVGITTNALVKGDGFHHMTSSGIFEVSGSVGIGLTNPSYKLHISGAFSSNPGFYVYGTTYGMVGVDRGSSASSAGVNYYTTGSQRWFTGIYENTNNFGFYNALSANFPMVITTGSRVGIGTTNPSHPLHVASSTVYQILAEQTSTDTSNTGAYATFYAVNNAGLSQVRGLFGAGGNSVGNTALRNAVYYGAQSDHSVVFMANDAERMRITNSGDVSMTGTGAIKIQSGTTAQRPSASTGQIRYNTSFNFLEYYDGSNWVPVVGQTSPGASASNPAESANEIKNYNPNATNGLYWIRQVGTVPIQAYCVFTDYNGSAIQGGPWTVPIISNDANTNFSTDGPTAAATFLSKCQAIGIASPGRGMENTRTTTEVYGAWLAVKRALWNNYSTFITNGTTGGGAVLRMPMININGAGGASDQRLVYNTSLGTHLPPNIDGDACNASQLFCGWWAGTDISGWRVNDNAIPGSEDWNPSDTVNSSYNGNGIQSALTVCVYK